MVMLNQIRLNGGLRNLNERFDFTKKKDTKQTCSTNGNDAWPWVRGDGYASILMKSFLS